MFFTNSRVGIARVCTVDGRTLGGSRTAEELARTPAAADARRRDEIPLDKRFYAGGGGSVRGYTFQSIGPRDAGNKPLGGASLLEVINYVEHYGLHRRLLPNGKYERTTPAHSWNSNQLLTNMGLFHLQRHSDHHAFPDRRYQVLRHYDQAPQLPTGYAGMYLLALVPPLWFKVMDPRVVKATGGDAARVNFLPAQRQRLVTAYGMKDTATSQATAQV